jgi:hypothetical protein
VVNVCGIEEELHARSIAQKWRRGITSVVPAPRPRSAGTSILS